MIIYLIFSQIPLTKYISFNDNLEKIYHYNPELKTNLGATMLRRLLPPIMLSTVGFFRTKQNIETPVPIDGRPKIAIIGAGLAGLTATYQLKKQALDVTVFEATQNIGGRVRTLRYEDGLYAEAGAMSICNTEHAIIELAESLELELIKRTDRSQKRIFMDGSWQGNEILNKPLREHLLSELKNLSITSDTNWLDPRLAHLDKISLTNYLINKLGESAGRETLDKIQCSLIGFYADDFSRLSMLDALRFMNQYAAASYVSSIKGGNQQLTEALAGAIGLEHIKLNTAVLKVSHTAEGVDITYKNKDKVITEHFDAVIVAVPLSMLQSNKTNAIKFTPELPFQDKLDGVQYNTKLVRVYYHLENRNLWSNHSTAMTTTDKPTFWIEDHTAHLKAPSSIIEAHASGPIGFQFQGINDAEIFGRQLIETVYPGFSKQVKGMPISVFWNSSMPYQAGAYPYFAPNQISVLADLQIPHGAILFAGEFTSLNCPASMNGAVESGLRAASQLVQQFACEREVIMKFTRQ